MSELLFMSPEHVAAMNAILADDPTVQMACASLERPVTLGYELTGGPGGRTVHWTVTMSETVQFALDPADADLLLRGDWAQMIRSSQASRDGTAVDPGVVPSGDLTLLQAIAPVLSAAASVATLPVRFPDTPPHS